MRVIESPPPASRRSWSVPDLADLSPALGEWTRPVRVQVCCFAILVSATFLAYAFVTPRWNARGLPSYLGYGKNVEVAATGLAVLGVTLFVILARRLAFSFASFAWLAIVFALIKVYYAGGMATAILLALVASSAVYFTWYDRLRDQASTAARNDVPRWHWWMASLLVFVLLALMFLNSCQRPGKLDFHHNGEQISSALDLLDGGVPFRTHFWPHGMFDSAVIALLIRLTGNVFGALNLHWAIVMRVLGFTGLFLFALGLVREPLAALLSAAIVSLRPPDLRDFVLEPSPELPPGPRSSKAVGGWCRDT